MSNALEVLKRIVREEYKNIKDGVNIHPSGFRDYTPEEDSDFDEPHSTERMESIKEDILSENPAASAAAAMVMMQMQNPDTGKSIQAITPLKNKDHKLHGKAKGIFKRLKDKFSKKKEPVDKVAQYRALVQKQKDDYNRESVKLTKTRIKEIIREEIQTVLTEGTRWLVGIEAPSGKIASTYGHWDGYPKHAGKMLKKYYNNPAKVKQLLKLGKNGISSIDKSMKGGKDHTFENPKKGETVFYGRDRGEKDRYGAMWASRDKVKFNSGEEFAYIWSVKDKKWYYKARYTNPQDWTELK
jgi:hypothetical protein|tara:strand:+ start:293 stop:1186 length:894 start_codon:yes stop_codon:yes gene_type:complete